MLNIFHRSLTIMTSRLPLVIILGATGSGKTKLSLELAKRFSGEIIGADSIQVYKALDIISAKATETERSLAPHHLIDILEPHEIFTVIEYRNRALSLINNIQEKNKLPIVVGGTNYYIESILWKILVENECGLVEKIGVLPNNEHQLPSEELHKRLSHIDPDMARRLHPNNKRKILRSLEIFYQKGRKHSDILNEQHSSDNASGSDGGLRFLNSLVLWLQCDQDILDKRLDERVDNMLEQGLLQELIAFHKLYNEKRIHDNESPDYTKGIFQSIGFKEFHAYLVLDEEERASDEGKKKLEEGISLLKMATKRYARKQKKWIVNRFLGRSDRKVPPVYGLDTTDVSQWNENVTKVAEEIVESYVSKTKCNHNSLPVRSVNSTPNSADFTYICEVCDRVFVGDLQWTLHRKSNRHKRALESRHKKLKKS
ncbi:tRNA dimethylallyltransferase [Anoplophora glabripennis]|uniref:tRNA dimethylallyltransferase n=1 Tax=Anoplophora glabripennis TaxID=217634 RepID=UPI00087379AF|nr:tRNA dimethylallyltransferase [Anoplophora glabripennis]XP_023310676.1 tRNA dimethylallyltransferase [Anoplophora glabripennis]